MHSTGRSTISHPGDPDHHIDGTVFLEYQMSQAASGTLKNPSSKRYIVSHSEMPDLESLVPVTGDFLKMDDPECLFDTVTVGCNWIQVGNDGLNVPVFPPTDSIVLVIGLRTSKVLANNERVVMRRLSETPMSRKIDMCLYAKTPYWRSLFFGIENDE